MPASTERQLGGSFRVECRAAADLPDDALQKLDAVLQGFVDSIPAGLFYPARSGDAAVLPPAPGDERRYRGRVFSAERLTPGAFRVLNGMLASFHTMTAPLATAAAYLNDGPVNLLRVRAPYPTAPTALPFEVEIAEPAEGVAPPASVRVEFVTPPPAEERETFLPPFATWNRLVWGGYPVDDDPPGESGVGATETHFLTPRVLEHAIESYRADARCFDLIVNLATAWSARHQIRAVYVE
ncbi:hypothetical protein tb265_17720 [Gemmatimonadetes bacterium T265]|nr:hypothetical protein tb265_17720 [Gemmatimonadetes bacterium T265]